MGILKSNVPQASEAVKKFASKQSTAGVSPAVCSQRSSYQLRPRRPRYIFSPLLSPSGSILSARLAGGRGRMHHNCAQTDPVTVLLLRIFCGMLLILILAHSASAQPQRIVSIAPSFTEILYALGAGPQIVGTTLYCDYPPAALKTEKIGDVLNPNVEKIISLKPDLVFAGNWKWNVPEKLRAAGIYVVEIPDAQSLEDVFNRFKLIGQTIGKKKQAAKLVEAMRIQMLEIRKRSENKPKKRVYMEIDAGNWTVGGTSYLTEILGLVGAENVFADRQEPYLTVTMESVVSRDPDVLLSLSRTKQEYEELGAWRALRAVKEGKIIDKNAIDWNAITHQGSRLIEGIRQLEVIFGSLP